ncbi:MAG TPA: GNAT family N-acetyltransferase [Steroidobacter sp.]|uniref:GNAT family N-acetyltransferase n=1 Tax=Steroidobacter sp. TaxID=1978227 RepID=UPI002ED9A348
MRPIVDSDVALFEHLYTDAETMRYIGPPLTPERAAKSFRSALAGMRRQPIERLFLTIVESATRTDVGICSLQYFDAGKRTVEVGMMFIGPARAKGYSKEGLLALIPAVFAHLPVDELWLQSAADHVAVQRLVLSVGFARRGEVVRQDAAAGNAPANGQRSAWSVRRDSWSPPSAVRNRQ